MSDMSDDGGDGIRGRGEQALGKIASEVLGSPIVHGAVARAFDAREKAVAAQEAALGALNLPSAADLARLTRRVRSVSQRLEGIEDGVDRLDQRLGALQTPAVEARLTGIEDALDKLQTTERLTGIEDALDKLARELEAVRKKLPATPPKRRTSSSG